MSKMTPSEAGKLGALKSAQSHKEQKKTSHSRI